MTNKLIPSEFFAYLEVNGYRRYISDDGDRISFIDNRKSVDFKYDTAKFYVYFDGSDDEAPDFSQYAEVYGVSQLDMFKFQLLMHIFDIVPMQKFLKQVPAEQKNDLFEQLAAALKPVPAY